MPPVGFEPMIAAGERAKTYALDRAATGTDRWIVVRVKQSRYRPGVAQRVPGS